MDASDVIYYGDARGETEVVLGHQVRSGSRSGRETTWQAAAEQEEDQKCQSEMALIAGSIAAVQAQRPDIGVEILTSLPS